MGEYAAFISDELVEDREMVVEVPLPNGGKVKQIVHPIKFSETPQEYKSIGIPPDMSHTKEVLIELGYKEEEIDEFEKTGLFS